MASRPPLVFGADGIPQQLQAGDDLSGPALGAATATTPPPGDSSTRVATTASVAAAVAAGGLTRGQVVALALGTSF